MVVCRFYQEGRCKYGNSCKFEHPREQGQQSYQNINRFGALSGGGFSRGGGGGGRVDSYRPGDSRDQTLKFSLNREHLEADFTAERPIWPMSCYGPGKDAPRQLIEGPEYEISPEEVRVLYYLAQASGDPARLEQYNQNERAASAKAQTAGQEIANNPDRFIQSVLDAENQHPNRLDQVVRPSGTWQRPQGMATANNTSAFGPRPSPFAISNQQNNTSAFGGGGTGTSGFGAPSALGGGTSAFGKPSMPGINTTAFGQASQRPAFGAASTLGGAVTPAFGAASQPGGTGFGQASALGNRPSPFTTPQTAPSAGFGFGAASNGAQQSSPFVQNNQVAQPGPFGQNNANAQQTSPFGQGNANKQQASHFGQSNGMSQTNPNPFGQENNSQQQANPFGQNASTAAHTSLFGQNSTGQQQSNSFGQPSNTNQQPQTGAFGQPSAQATTAFGQPSATTNGAFGGQSAQAALNPFARPNGTSTAATNSNPNVPIQSWHGTPVTYLKIKTKAATNVPTIQNTAGKPQRIWHPHGPPNPLPEQAQAPPETYTGDLGFVLKEAYEFVVQNGQFKNGIMPEIPPKNEWVVWDV